MLLGVLHLSGVLFLKKIMNDWKLNLAICEKACCILYLITDSKISVFISCIRCILILES